MGEISGDIGLSTQTLKTLKSVDLKGAGVITIDNLTSFHKYNAQNEFVIYLGGFHNRAKRDFIRLVGSCNPNTQFRHFGDIDAGGFYILEHLKAKTEMQFIPHNMDRKTLEENSRHWKPLSENNRTRVQLLSERTLPMMR